MEGRADIYLALGRSTQISKPASVYGVMALLASAISTHGLDIHFMLFDTWRC